MEAQQVDPRERQLKVVRRLIAASEALSNFKRRRICGSVNFLGGRAMVLIFLAPTALRTIFWESIVR